MELNSVKYQKHQEWWSECEEWTEEKTQEAQQEGQVKPIEAMGFKRSGEPNTEMMRTWSTDGGTQEQSTSDTELPWNM